MNTVIRIVPYSSFCEFTITFDFRDGTKKTYKTTDAKDAYQILDDYKVKEILFIGE